LVKKVTVVRASGVSRQNWKTTKYTVEQLKRIDNKEISLAWVAEEERKGQLLAKKSK
jgi:hypothetical protein